MPNGFFIFCNGSTTLTVPTAPNGLQYTERNMAPLDTSTPMVESSNPPGKAQAKKGATDGSRAIRGSETWSHNEQRTFHI